VTIGRTFSVRFSLTNWRTKSRGMSVKLASGRTGAEGMVRRGHSKQATAILRTLSQMLSSFLPSLSFPQNRFVFHHEGHS